MARDQFLQQHFCCQVLRSSTQTPEWVCSSFHVPSLFPPLGYHQHAQTNLDLIVAVLQNPRGLWCSQLLHLCSFCPGVRTSKVFQSWLVLCYAALMDQWFWAFPKTTYKGALWFHTFIFIREIKVNWLKCWMCSLCACSHLWFSTPGKVKSNNIYFQLWMFHPAIQLVCYLCGAPKYMQQNCQSCSGLRCFRDFWGCDWNNL